MNTFKTVKIINKSRLKIALSHNSFKQKAEKKTPINI